MSDHLSSYQGYLQQTSIPLPKYDYTGLDLNQVPPPIMNAQTQQATFIQTDLRQEFNNFLHQNGFEGTDKANSSIDQTNQIYHKEEQSDASAACGLKTALNFQENSKKGQFFRNRNRSQTSNYTTTKPQNAAQMGERRPLDSFKPKYANAFQRKTPTTTSVGKEHLPNYIIPIWQTTADAKLEKKRNQTSNSPAKKQVIQDFENLKNLNDRILKDEVLGQFLNQAKEFEMAAGSTSAINSGDSSQKKRKQLTATPDQQFLDEVKEQINRNPHRYYTNLARFDSFLPKRTKSTLSNNTHKRSSMPSILQGQQCLEKTNSIACQSKPETTQILLNVPEVKRKQAKISNNNDNQISQRNTSKDSSMKIIQKESLMDQQKPRQRGKSQQMNYRRQIKNMQKFRSIKDDSKQLVEPPSQQLQTLSHESIQKAETQISEAHSRPQDEPGAKKKRGSVFRARGSRSKSREMVQSFRSKTDITGIIFEKEFYQSSQSKKKSSRKNLNTILQDNQIQQAQQQQHHSQRRNVENVQEFSPYTSQNIDEQNAKITPIITSDKMSSKRIAKRLSDTVENLFSDRKDSLKLTVINSAREQYQDRVKLTPKDQNDANFDHYLNLENLGQTSAQNLNQSQTGFSNKNGKKYEKIERKLRISASQLEKCDESNNIGNTIKIVEDQADVQQKPLKRLQQHKQQNTNQFSLSFSLESSEESLANRLRTNRYSRSQLRYKTQKEAVVVNEVKQSANQTIKSLTSKKYAEQGQDKGENQIKGDNSIISIDVANNQIVENRSRLSKNQGHRSSKEVIKSPTSGITFASRVSNRGDQLDKIYKQQSYFEGKKVDVFKKQRSSLISKNNNTRGASNATSIRSSLIEHDRRKLGMVRNFKPILSKDKEVLEVDTNREENELDHLNISNSIDSDLDEQDKIKLESQENENEKNCNTIAVQSQNESIFNVEKSDRGGKSSIIGQVYRNSDLEKGIQIQHSVLSKGKKCIPNNTHKKDTLEINLTDLMQQQDLKTQAFEVIQKSRKNEKQEDSERKPFTTKTEAITKIQEGPPEQFSSVLRTYLAQKDKRSVARRISQTTVFQGQKYQNQTSANHFDKISHLISTKKEAVGNRIRNQFGNQKTEILSELKGNEKEKVNKNLITSKTEFKAVLPTQIQDKKSIFKPIISPIEGHGHLKSPLQTSLMENCNPKAPDQNLLKNNCSQIAPQPSIQDQSQANKSICSQKVSLPKSKIISTRVIKTQADEYRISKMRNIYQEHASKRSSSIMTCTSDKDSSAQSAQRESVKVFKKSKLSIDEISLKTKQMKDSNGFSAVLKSKVQPSQDQMQSEQMVKSQSLFHNSKQRAKTTIYNQRRGKVDKNSMKNSQMKKSLDNEDLKVVQDGDKNGIDKLHPILNQEKEQVSQQNAQIIDSGQQDIIEANCVEDNNIVDTRMSQNPEKLENIFSKKLNAIQNKPVISKEEIWEKILEKQRHKQLVNPIIDVQNSTQENLQVPSQQMSIERRLQFSSIMALDNLGSGSSAICRNQTIPAAIDSLPKIDYSN